MSITILCNRFGCRESLFRYNQNIFTHVAVGPIIGGK